MSAVASLIQELQNVKFNMKNTTSHEFVMVGYGNKSLFFQTRRLSLTPNDEHPPWAPGGGTLDIEEPMPGAPLGNKPRAFRFKPGIRLDWSWREKSTFLLTQNTSQAMYTLLINTTNSFDTLKVTLQLQK